jgi:serine/tyrosine/threonine adenylyltransferase
MASESMYHLGIPTTRALSLCLTGDKIIRDIMYDGNAKYEPGAVVCRVAPTFIRFGNFEIFASRNDVTTLKTLTDFTIKNYFPHLISCHSHAPFRKSPLGKGGNLSKKIYISFLQEVAEKTLDMIIEWQRV